MLTLLPTEDWEYGLADMLRALRAVMVDGGSMGALTLPGLGPCVPTRSARSALVVALQSLALAPGGRVGVPLYCCPVVFKAIVAAGLRPLFIDVEPGTLCMSAADLRDKRSRIVAAIAAHMFGNVCDMVAVRDAMAEKPVIEDCAQSIGSMLHGRHTGSFGIISVFSFRSGKYLSVGEGGALFSDDRDVSSRMLQSVAAMPAPGAAQECGHVFKTYVRTKLRTAPLYGVVGYRLWRTYARRVTYLEQTPIVLGRIYSTDLSTVKARLPRLETAIAIQRAHADAYQAKLKVDSGMLCRETSGAFYNRYHFPIVFPSANDRDRVAACLRDRRIDALQPYRDIARVAIAHYGYAGDCPVAERVAEGVLTIPCHYRLSESTVDYVAHALNAACRH